MVETEADATSATRETSVTRSGDDTKALATDAQPIIMTHAEAKP